MKRTLAASTLPALIALILAAPLAAQEEDPFRLSDEPLPPQEWVPARPKPLLELGDPFLGAGTIQPGVEIPTGAVWQPSLLVFGTLRTAFGAFDTGATTSEIATRLDLFANLQLSGTERLLVGFRPLDDRGRFTRYTYSPGPDEGFEAELDGRLQTLFFEGDFGELFPGLDPDDSDTNDWGFAIGRQPLRFQEGLLIEDAVDAIGVTRNTLLPGGTSNLRITGLWGFNDVGRDDNVEDRSAHLFGLFTEADTRPSTVSFDTVWVHDRAGESDALYLGAGAVQRLGHYNTSLRGVSSFPFRDDTPEASTGTLFLAEVSRDLPASTDLVYANAFVGVREFSSAARGPNAGGPLGRVGILFEAVGLGTYGAALGNDADRSVGGSIGLQTFLGEPRGDTARQQFVLEIGGRTDTDGRDAGALAVGARFQRRLGQHLVLRLDGFVTGRESDEAASGGRLELVVKF